MMEILQSGTLTTLQDAGRPGHRHLGVPTSGAADRLSFALANWLVGNAWDAPAIECNIGGQHFKFHMATQVGIAGAEMSAQINGRSVKNFTSFPVDEGDILTLSPARLGCRTYVAIAGGLGGEAFLGSVSTYAAAGVGGLDGGPLRTGDKFKLTPSGAARRAIPPGFQPHISNHVVLRARPGPEYFDLTLPCQRHLYVSPFYARSQTNRMGARLKGDKLSLTTNADHMVSGPMLPGTLQIPPDGGPILALIDGHCTGGYARILQVIRADFWIMGQIGPGTTVSFQRCFTGDAPAILKRRNALYGSLIDGFEF